MAREQCPVCSASDLEELIVLDDYPMAGTGVVTRDSADKVPTGTLSIGFCRKCGSVFQLDPVSADELDAMLALQPKPMSMQETGMEVSETERFIDSLKKYGPREGRVLDVGCGTGSLMVRLKELGFKDIVGVEANPDAVKIAREKDLEVVEGRFEEGMFEDESFDLIVTRSVLDHAIEPATLLATMENILVPGGVLAVEVPNAGRVFQRRAFGGFTPHHLMYWTVPTLKYALTFQGLDLLGGFEESYIAMFGQKVEKGESPLEPVPPTDEEVDMTWEDVNDFLDRKDRIAEELPDVVREQGPRGIVILGAGTPTVDLLYYTGMHDQVVRVVTSDKMRQGNVVAGSKFVVESMDALEKKDDFDAVLVSSERRQEELLDRLESFLDRGGKVFRFKPDLELI